MFRRIAKALCNSFIGLTCSYFLTFSTSAQNASFATDRLLVKPRAGVSQSAFAMFRDAQGSAAIQTFPRLGGIQVVRVPRSETVESLIAKFQKSGLVDFAEPDYAVHGNLSPNDPYFANGTLWALNNTGQSGGVADADIDAPEGWDVLTSASNIVVAVLDSGIRASHEDLAANMWTNLNDGGHGFNAFTGGTDAGDDNGHGCLTSGVLGAVGNNGKGVVGVAWRVQLMSCKCLDSAANGSDSTVIACIEYAITNGAKIMNASFDSPSYSQAVSNAIHAAREAGIIFVASAGNNGANLDVSPRYPSCYQIDNIVSVAATTRTDALWSSSNYGVTNVDLAAPGDQIYSCFFIHDSFYLGPLSGTSLSAPAVSGALALLLAKYPAETYQEIISRLLNGTDPLPALAGKCASGGRLNLRKALSPPLKLTELSVAPFQLRASGGPNRTCVIEMSTNLVNWSAIYTNTTSTNGTFDFMDSGSTAFTKRFYRVTSSL